MEKLFKETYFLISKSSSIIPTKNNVLMRVTLKLIGFKRVLKIPYWPVCAEDKILNYSFSS